LAIWHKIYKLSAGPMIMIVVLTKDNFEKEVLKSDKPILVEFWAEWCGPCRMMAPVIDDASKEINNVKFAKLNIDEENEIASKYNVQSIPTFIIFKLGKETNRVVGYMNKDDFIDRIKKATK